MYFENSHHSPALPPEPFGFPADELEFSSHSLLRGIQGRLDAALGQGPGGQVTRVTIGRMPPAPPRFPQRPVLFPPSPVAKRRAGGAGADDAAGGESKKTETRAAAVDKSAKRTEKKKKIVSVSADKDAAFSELIGDLLKDDPLPFIKDA